MLQSIAAPKYRWRILSEKQRSELLEWRKSRGHPPHSPPHRAGTTSVYHLSATCYEHAPHIGKSVKRMPEFCEQLLEVLIGNTSVLYAWCVLPNHYHLLIRSADILLTIKQLGLLHGRTSYAWNKEDESPGRQVWFRCLEKNIRGERHRFATMNYIHNNPVHHGYVENGSIGPSEARLSFPTKRASMLREKYGRNIRSWILAKGGMIHACKIRAG
jgi:putative transposase